MRRLATAAWVLALAALSPNAAWANGRFPSADQLVPDPADPQHLILRATFGLLQSHDAGQSFSWICEDAIGYSGDRDPALAVLADGSVLAGFARDLRASQADGCVWSSPASAASTLNLLDATADPGAAERALFVSHSLGADHQVQVFLADGSASSFAPLGAPLGDDFSPLTLEVAPSRPDRLYVSGIQDDGKSVLLRSDDRGETWARLMIEPDAQKPAYIAAIDPQDPDRVYLRVDGDTSDALLVTDDGGRSFSEAFSLPADMLGFALSPDGTQIVLGGPGVGQFVANARELSFTPAAFGLTGLTCLKWTSELGLLACAREVDDGFTVGRSNDAGDSFTPLFHLKDLAPLSCASSTDTGARCPSAWPAVASTLGIDVSAAAGSAGNAGPAAKGGCAFSGRARASNAAFLAAALAGVACFTRRRQRRQGTSM